MSRQLSSPAGMAHSGDGLTARAWATLIVLCGALFLDALDVSMIGVALPSIRNDLGISQGSLQWVVSGYVLGYGGFLLLGGRAADLLGRRRVFLASLAVFLVASGLSSLTDNGTMLIATRFLKGVSAAFTTPAGLSIITTSFAEGRARNRALSIYSATGATGFSLGLVFSGLLTELSWRWVMFMPVPLALLTLVAAIKLVPETGRAGHRAQTFDLAGASLITAAMLGLVYTVVQAPQAGWASPRTLLSFVGVAALVSAFVWVERRSRAPLVRLGILRSGRLIRANIGAMSLTGAYFGFQFIATMYMQDLRGWSALETGLALFPGGATVAILAPRVTPKLVERFGVTKVILAGLISATAAYALFLPISTNSAYAPAILPTALLAGLGFALAYSPLSIAATNGIRAEEQGLAGGLLNTSFQFGGALVLAIVSAVNDAWAGSGGSDTALLDGYRAALVVPLIVTVASVGVTLSGLVSRPQVGPSQQLAGGDD